MTPYPTLALSAIEAAGVPRLLTRQHTAIVLERLARAAGSTNWYFVDDPPELEDLAKRLRPGSSLSFYFDGRLAARPYDSEVAQQILEIARRDRDAVVGRLCADGMTIEVDFVASKSELDDFVQNLEPGELIFYGPFPARDNDGERAVTIALPDRDGVVRPHPH